MTRAKVLLCSLLLSLFVTAASAQTLSIVSGNGQITCVICLSGTKTSFDPLVVKVTDATGKPMVNATVSWIQLAGSGALDTSQTTTDGSGLSQNNYRSGFNLTPGINPFDKAIITVAAGASTVQFTEVQALLVKGQETIPQVNVSIPNMIINGAAGTVSATPLAVSITGGGNIYSAGIQGVSVSLITDDQPGGPTISCLTDPGQAPGVAISDVTGTANCRLQFGNIVGTQGTFKVVVGGGYVTSGVFTYTVSVGPPSKITIRGSNSIPASAPGTNLPVTLLAAVTDLGNNPAGNANVTWSVTPSTAATLYNSRSASGSDGLVSTNVTIANPNGSFTVTVALTDNPAVSASWTITAPLVTISSLNKVAGSDGQTANQNSVFASPVAVVAATNGVPTAGVAVNFAVTSGSATLSAASAITNSNGQASVTVTAGNTPGPVVITATSGTYVQTFNLTVLPPGASLTTDSFVNGISLQRAAANSGGISPCSIAAIQATGVATGVSGVLSPALPFGPLPTKLNNVQVMFNNIKAPIFNIANQNGQESVTVQVPCELSAGNVQATVTVGSVAKTVTVNLKSASPGVLTSVQSDGVTRAVLIRPDGTYVDAGTNPARRGETVHALATGLGLVNILTATGAVPVPGADGTIAGSPIVGVNNSGVQVVSVKLAANLIGMYDVAFVIPSDAPAGDVNFSVAVNPADGGGTQYSQGTKINVQ